MTILITGGAGFIGANFINSWFDKTDEMIINLDKLTYAGNLSNLNTQKNNSAHIFKKGDICDQNLVAELLAHYKPRAILNFAAETHVDRSIDEPEVFVQTNIIGTFNLLECARKYWNSKNGKEQASFRFIHVSTDEVYGSLSSIDPPFTENNRFEPNSPYSASKASSDHLVRAYFQTYGLPTITTNCSNNYGPLQFPEKLIPLTIKNALSNAPLPIYGDGLQIRDWLYVVDHCNAIIELLEKGKIGEVYNIGGCNEKTNLEVVSIICAKLDEIKPISNTNKLKNYRELINFVKDRPGHDRRYAINSDKLEKHTGWNPTETFETGIEKTIFWYLQQ